MVMTLRQVVERPGRNPGPRLLHTLYDARTVDVEIRPKGFHVALVGIDEIIDALLRQDAVDQGVHFCCGQGNKHLAPPPFQDIIVNAQ